ncbi:MAG: DNA polymerase III subunit alpha [Alphaproteobacteria bacterium]|nr:MAG: DNA polymerase III subunit alpha [Alphaproteobacteria bacterium]
MAEADNKGFIHLRNHTAYSLSEGALKIDYLAELCKKQNMPAVAIADTNNLFGAIEFADAAVKAGVQPIFGSQFSLAREEKGGKQFGLVEYDQIVLIAQNEAGYMNLLALQALAYEQVAAGKAAHITIDQILSHNAGLICLSGGAKGAPARHIRANQPDKAIEFCRTILNAFGNRFYIEIQRHNLAEENSCETALINLAYQLNIPLVATNECYFATPDMYEAHDALLCIAEGKVVGDPDRRKVTPDHYFKSAAEMRAMFADLPEACDNTIHIAKRCSFILKGRNPLLPHFEGENDEEESDILRRKAREGLTVRMQSANIAGDALKPYQDRLEFELDVIVKMGFAGYFLIVADFIQWSKANGIPVGPGRGSGAGSVVAWALTITDLDPLRWGLLFERFLNPERVSMPDFDIDFCQDRRDEVIRYVQTRYGNDKVAQIITFGKLQARAVVRDVGRVLAMAYGHVDKICKMIPNNPAAPVTLQQAVDGEPLIQQMIKDDEAVSRLIKIALKLEGLYRHASTHAAGVVIGDRPLQQLVPMYRDPRSDIPVTQFSMKYVEKAGLVKFDFLGLKTLTVIQSTVALLKQQGIDINIDTIPLDDRKTYDMLGQGEATGVFQLESSGMREVLKKLKPDRFEDITAIVALYRPGPMDNIPKFIACKQGIEKPDYLHPKLETILRETYGVIVYQEQVMQIAQILSGYTLGNADLLRRAMGKKIQAEMDAQRESFVAGAVNTNGLKPDYANHIFDLVDKFAGYGFNKSHAAAYALISYQTAYLKANFPAQFMAAQMTLEMGDTDKLSEFREELKRLKIELLSPDINKSMPKFAVENGAVRYALAALKGVGLEAMKALCAERADKGEYKNLDDFIRRMDSRILNKRQLESLINAGAFDSLHANRAELSLNLEAILRQAQANRAEQESNQNNLFAGGGGAEDKFKLQKSPNWNMLERLQKEFSAIGYYLTAHPLDSYTALLRRLHVTSALEIPTKVMEKRTGKLTLAGVMLSKKERRSAKGNKYAFVEFTDASGSFELTFFSEILSSSRELLESGKPLLLTADYQMDGETSRMTAQSVRDLASVAAEHKGNMNIIVSMPEAIEPLAQNLNSYKQSLNGKGGRSGKQLKLFLHLPLHEIEIDLPGYPIPVGPAAADISAIAGVRVEEV